MDNTNFPHYSNLEHLRFKVDLYNQQRTFMQNYLLNKLTHCAKLASLTPNNARNSIQRKHLLTLYNQIK